MKNNIGLQFSSHAEVVYISGTPGFVKKTKQYINLHLYYMMNIKDAFLAFVHATISRLKMAAITG